MDRINGLRRSFRRRFKKLTADEDTENEDFTMRSNDEKKCISWTIENTDVCPLETGEYLESPPFYTGFLNGTKWILRLYPRGRNSRNSGKVGLFIFRISSAAKCSIQYQFILHDSKPIEDYYYNKFIYQDLDEYGTDEFLFSNYFSEVNLLKIECNMLVRYVDEVEKYQISDTGFPNCNCALSRDFKDMYLEEKHADATLQVGETKIPVHKAILGARSKVFSDLLKSNRKEESSPDLISIEEIEGPIEEPVVRDLLLYIYTGNIEHVTLDKAISLYPLAKRYSLMELQKLCLNVILETMSVENFCSIATLAEKYPSSKLKLTMKNFFCNYSSQILEREEWKTFIREKRLIASEMLETLTAEHRTKCSTAYTDDS